MAQATSDHPWPAAPPPIHSPPLRSDSPRIIEPQEEWRSGFKSNPQSSSRLEHRHLPLEHSHAASEVQIYPPQTAMSRITDPVGPNRTLTPQSSQQDPTR